MANITVYAGKASETYNKIQEGYTSIHLNQVYTSKTAKALFYINSKGYMHILQAGKTTMNGITKGYHLTDYILTKDNKLKDNGNYTRDFDTIEELKQAIENITRAAA